MLFKKKTPGETIIASENKKDKLRNKRSKLDHSDPNYHFKKDKINGKIHKENVKIRVAELELQTPVKNETKINKKTSINFTNNDNGKSYHLHGHYHSSGKKDKK